MRKETRQQPVEILLMNPEVDGGAIAGVEWNEAVELRVVTPHGRVIEAGLESGLKIRKVLGILGLNIGKKPIQELRSSEIGSQPLPNEIVRVLCIKRIDMVVCHARSFASRHSALVFLGGSLDSFPRIRF